MKRRKSFKLRLSIYFICVAVVVMITITYIDYAVGNTVKSFAESDANLIINALINDIVIDYLKSHEVDYFYLVTLEKDNAGKVTAIIVDSVKLNRIKSEISRDIINHFSKLESKSFGIPMGTVLKSKLFSARGFNLYIKIIPLGAFTSSIDNNFVSTGINQSLHSIYLNFNAMVKIAAPFSDAVVSVTERICLAETVLLGDVPNTYLQFKGSNGEDYIKYFSGN